MSHPDNPAYGNDVFCFAVKAEGQDEVLFHRKEDAEKCAKDIRGKVTVEPRYIYLSHKDYMDNL